MRRKIITTLLLSPLVVLGGILLVGTTSGVAGSKGDPVEQPSRAKLDFLIRQRDDYIRQYDNLLEQQRKFVRMADYDVTLTSTKVRNTFDQIESVGDQLRRLRKEIEKEWDQYNDAFKEYAQYRAGHGSKEQRSEAFAVMKAAGRREASRLEKLSHHNKCIQTHNATWEKLDEEHGARLQQYTNALQAFGASDPRFSLVLNAEARQLDLMEIEIDRLDEVMNRISDQRHAQ